MKTFKEWIFQENERKNKIEIFNNIVFLSGDEAEPCLDIINDDGEEAAIAYLSDWDYGEANFLTLTDKIPWGKSDYVYYDKEGYGYILSYNSRIGYVSLTYAIVKDRIFDVIFRLPIKNDSTMKKLIDDFVWYDAFCYHVISDKLEEEGYLEESDIVREYGNKIAELNITPN